MQRVRNSSSPQHSSQCEQFRSGKILEEIWDKKNCPRSRVQSGRYNRNQEENRIGNRSLRTRSKMYFSFWKMFYVSGIVWLFFFQAEDGIRDWSVTGVQTCALPI